MLSTRGNALNRTVAAEKGCSLTFGMATGFLYRAPSFLPHTRHPSRYSFAGQNVEERGEPRIRSTLSRGPERHWGCCEPLTGGGASGQP
jgi:hypothetical protein